MHPVILQKASPEPPNHALLYPGSGVPLYRLYASVQHRAMTRLDLTGGTDILYWPAKGDLL